MLKLFLEVNQTDGPVTVAEKEACFLVGFGPVTRYAYPSKRTLTEYRTFWPTMTGIWAIKLNLQEVSRCHVSRNWGFSLFHGGRLNFSSHNPRTRTRSLSRETRTVCYSEAERKEEAKKRSCCDSLFVFMAPLFPSLFLVSHSVCFGLGLVLYMQSACLSLFLYVYGCSCGTTPSLAPRSTYLWFYYYCIRMLVNCSWKSTAQVLSVT